MKQQPPQSHQLTLFEQRLSPLQFSYLREIANGKKYFLYEIYANTAASLLGKRGLITLDPKDQSAVLTRAGVEALDTYYRYDAPKRHSTELTEHLQTMLGIVSIAARRKRRAA